MFTLKMCIGMFLALCGSYREMDFKTEAECLKAREQMVKSVGDGYAVCVPHGTPMRGESKKDKP